MQARGATRLLTPAPELAERPAPPEIPRQNNVGRPHRDLGHRTDLRPGIPCDRRAFVASAAEGEELDAFDARVDKVVAASADAGTASTRPRPLVQLNESGIPVDGGECAVEAAGRQVSTLDSPLHVRALRIVEQWAPVG